MSTNNLEMAQPSRVPSAIGLSARSQVDVVGQGLPPVTKLRETGFSVGEVVQN